MAWNRKIPYLEVETDSEMAIQLIKNGNVKDHPDEVFITDCRKLLRKPWNSHLMHTRRQGNRCADALAELGHCSSYVIICSDTSPLESLAILADDCKIF